MVDVSVALPGVARLRGVALAGALVLDLVGVDEGADALELPELCSFLTFVKCWLLRVSLNMDVCHADEGKVDGEER